jgi:hypothetical protein
MGTGLRTQTSAARVHCRRYSPFDAGEPSHMGCVLSGQLGRGADVMSKAERSKSAAPVSLAGS